MKLYLAPGACSLADHIALHEAGIAFDHVKVDLRAKTTESGDDFKAINPKGYVPALMLDDGELITENLAILDWVGQQAPALVPPGPMGRTRLLEALGFISTEIHKSFKPLFQGGTDEEKDKAKKAISGRLDMITAMFKGDYLFGATPTPADFYLFVMLLWCDRHGIPLSAPMSAFKAQLMTRPSVETAMRDEGLI